jgi:hypothetical protein
MGSRRHGGSVVWSERLPTAPDPPIAASLTQTTGVPGGGTVTFNFEARDNLSHPVPRSIPVTGSGGWLSA